MGMIKFLNEVKEPKVQELGGKGYSLAVLMNNGFNVPKGFAITSEAFFKFLEENNLIETIEKLSSQINKNNFQEKSKEIRELILRGKIPEEIISEIKEALNKLNVEYVSIRSSAVSEDSLKASFAGLHDTFLNVITELNIVLENLKKCWVSLFNDRVVIYRIKKKIPHLEGMAVIIQEMIQSEVSGITFTNHPTKRDTLLIEYTAGIGDRIVSGKIIPNSIIIKRSTFEVLEKNCIEDVSLSEDIINELVSICLKIERAFNSAQDIEWCISKNTIWILQSRAITTYIEETKRKLILEGLGTSPGVIRGKVKVVLTPKEANKMKDGEILVTVMTNPLYVVAIQRAKAIITDVGGMICHASIVARELGIPCVVGTKKATKILKDGMEVIVDGSEGKVYLL